MQAFDRIEEPQLERPPRRKCGIVWARKALAITVLAATAIVVIVIIGLTVPQTRYLQSSGQAGPSGNSALSTGSTDSSAKGTVTAFTTTTNTAGTTTTPTISHDESTTPAVVATTCTSTVYVTSTVVFVTTKFPYDPASSVVA